MGDDMSEDAFDGLLYQIIDAHDKAARNRRRWRYAAMSGVAAFIIASYLIN